MAIEIRKVPKEGSEDFFFQAQDKLNNLDAELEAKVNEYRNSLVAEFEEKRVRLQNILDIVSEEKEFEVPDVVEPVCGENVPEGEPSDEQYSEVIGE